MDETRWRSALGAITLVYDETNLRWRIYQWEAMPASYSGDILIKASPLRQGVGTQLGLRRAAGKLR